MQLTMHDYTKYLTIFGRIPIRQLYCKKLLFKVYVSSMTPTWLQWQGIIEVITFDSTNSLTIHNTKFALITDWKQKLFYSHVYLTLLICADMDKTEDPLASSGDEMDSSAPAAAKKDRSRDVASGSSYQPSRRSSSSSRNSSAGGPLPNTSASNPNCISNLSLQIRKIKMLQLLHVSWAAMTLSGPRTMAHCMATPLWTTGPSLPTSGSCTTRS